jgi:hypothetical protein
LGIDLSQIGIVIDPSDSERFVTLTVLSGQVFIALRKNVPRE